MPASIWNDVATQSLRYGFLGKAELIPNDAELWTIVHYSEGGINKARLINPKYLVF